MASVLSLSLFFSRSICVCVYLCVRIGRISGTFVRTPKQNDNNNETNKQKKKSCKKTGPDSEILHACDQHAGVGRPRQSLSNADWNNNIEKYIYIYTIRIPRISISFLIVLIFFFSSLWLLSLLLLRCYWRWFTSRVCSWYNSCVIVECVCVCFIHSNMTIISTSD